MIPLLIILSAISAILLVIYFFNQEFFLRHIVEHLASAAILVLVLCYLIWRILTTILSLRRGTSELRMELPTGRVELRGGVSSEQIERIAKALALGLVSGTQSSAHKAIQEELKELREGKILFNPNKYMRVGELQIIEARISKSLSTDLGESLKGSGEPVVEKLAVGDVMKANLSGDGFDIEGSSSEAQLVPDDDFAHWTWNVTPIKSGRRTLILLVTVQIKVRGVSDTSHDVPVLERDVEVLINPVYTTRRFLAANWKWIAGTIAIPVIIWAANEAGLLDELGIWLSLISNSGSRPVP